MKKLLLPYSLIAFHMFILVNLRFDAWPEMLIYPYLVNNGFTLFRDIINPYLPFLAWFLAAFFSILDLSISNLKLLTWGVILLSDFLVYFVAKKKYGKVPATIALTFFVIFQPMLDGNGLWHDLVLVPILLLAFAKQSPLLLSVGFFTKQSVLWLLPIFIKKWRQLTLALAAIFLLSLVPFILHGTAKDYLFWAWKFPFTIFPTMPGHKDFGTLQLWLLALFPFAVPSLLVLLKPLNPKQILNPNKPFIWTILSFLFIFPRFGLFHLQPALAFAALSLASSVRSLDLKKYSNMPLVKLLAISYLLFVVALWHRQIILFWQKPTRFFEPEILQASKLLKESTDPGIRLLFLNAPDQLMILSDRLPTKPWAITFPWYLELPGVQERFISAVKQQKVKTVVFSAFQSQGKFTPGSYIPDKLENFVQTQFPNTTILSKNIQLRHK